LDAATKDLFNPQVPKDSEGYPPSKVGGNNVLLGRFSKRIFEW
jgi:hypothetical protein